MSPPIDPIAFRRAFLRVDAADRDRWVDRVLGIDELPEDGPDLPRGCVSYLPSSVDVLMHTIERARVTPMDVFVDVGSGLGRAAMLVHLLTGADAIGLEIQMALAARARSIAEGLQLERVRTIQGDAIHLLGSMGVGSVFFFYCPFESSRMQQAMRALEPLARARPLRLCFVDTPPPRLEWLSEEPGAHDNRHNIAVCSTRLHDDASAQSATSNLRR